MKNKIIYLSILVIIIITYNACSQQVSQSKINFNIARDGIVHIGAKSDSISEKIIWCGTGFAVDSICTFITAKHVLRNINKERIVIRFQIPNDRTRVRTVSARVLFEHATKDIAFLRIDSIGNHSCKSGSLYNFKIFPTQSIQTLVGEEIFIIGHPKISKTDNFDIPILRGGIISSTEIKFGEEPMLLLDLQGVPGFSGSPVILQSTGEVVGIVYGGLNVFGVL
jgi:S1-C subfamily serine protease